ncbi:MAG: hypothetical protein HS111_26215 [Kofleriaceae bacterium]|nr:hypothetical protein [Kofleriaceae bacterium]
MIRHELRAQLAGGGDLELAGYYRPLASVREGSVVLFDGRNPALVDGWPALDPHPAGPRRERAARQLRSLGR